MTKPKRYLGTEDWGLSVERPRLRLRLRLRIRSRLRLRLRKKIPNLKLQIPNNIQWPMTKLKKHLGPGAEWRKAEVQVVKKAGEALWRLPAFWVCGLVSCQAGAKKATKAERRSRPLRRSCLFLRHSNPIISFKDSKPLLDVLRSASCLRSTNRRRSGSPRRSGLTLLSGTWSVYENCRLSKPERLPPLSTNAIAIVEIFIGSLFFLSNIFDKVKRKPDFSTET